MLPHQSELQHYTRYLRYYYNRYLRYYYNRYLRYYYNRYLRFYYNRYLRFYYNRYLRFYYNRYLRLTLSVPDEGYSRHTSFALNLISTFSLLSLARYLCWWTINPRGYHPPSSQCFGTDTTCFWNNLHQVRSKSKYWKVK
jgi:hypothetical protein